MMKRSTFYGLDADQVSKNEALRYFDIENMVHYLYEAGKEPLNNYVYCAMLLVKIVFSQEEGKWGEAFREWIRRQFVARYISCILLRFSSMGTRGEDRKLSPAVTIVSD